MQHVNNTTIVDLKARGKKVLPVVVPAVRVNAAYPAQAEGRVFVSRDNEPKLSLLSPWQEMFARWIARILIPMLLIHPVARVYADEVVESAPPAPASEALPPPEDVVVSPPNAGATTVEAPPSSDVSTETPTSVESAPDVISDEAQTEIPASAGDPPTDSSVEVTPEEGGGDELSTPVPDTEVSEGETGVQDGDVTTDVPVPDPIDTVTDPEVASSAETATSSETTEGEAASEIPSTESTGGGTVAPISDADTNTDATDTSTLPDEPAPETLDEEAISDLVPTPQDPSEENAPSDTEDPPLVIDEGTTAQQEIAKEERLRSELKREVEEEFLRGCISFEASGYYCLKQARGDQEAKPAAKSSVTVESAVGVGGDKDIFVVDGVNRTLLTSNDWDDSFPTVDALGEQFVWQGMKSGRWQIFTGKLSASGTPSVEQVTFSQESNFNPKIDGEHLVWQGWADGNWEIFLATSRDAKSPFAGEHLPEGNILLNVGPEWSVERLTRNTEHDMFPSLHGDIVTWQSREGGDWVVYAYSISTKKQTKLSSDGVKSENPRFSITWEERDQDGNARLVGYDLATGEKTDLTKESQRLPTNTFPDPNDAPLTQPDQAALPVNQGSGTSTPSRGDDDGDGDNDITP